MIKLTEAEPPTHEVDDERSLRLKNLLFEYLSDGSGAFIRQDLVDALTDWHCELRTLKRDVNSQMKIVDGLLQRIL